ncbi:Hypothetical Protein FCC1311_060092 [Hondaea fermentalgiana]|uniref:Uncharacterized protein n=1 Tax=Hondaea fermentalgiana TaxID=2315210 RepID=A0A2R5GHH4_9STRA|nr:Hypothetical Protein FCC1311_060092 [Hondaea fermentalgiana]|eukprot:GBG29789.1 Hypothetical Protein FCC1311_060092 [Hondaea fermentalgiana]
MATPDGLPASAHDRAWPLGDTHAVGFARNEHGYVTGLKREKGLKVVAMSSVTPRQVRQDCRSVAEADLSAHLLSQHADAVAKSPALCVHIFIDAYNAVLRVFGFDCRVFYDLSAARVREIAKHGIGELAVQREFLGGKEGGLIPDALALFRHNEEVRARGEALVAFKHTAAAYNAAFRYLRTQDPCELRLAPAPQEVEDLVNTLLSTGIWAGTPSGIALPTQRKEKASCSNVLFPVLNFAALRALRPNSKIKPLIENVEQRVFTSLAELPGPVLCLKVGDFFLGPQPDKVRVVNLAGPGGPLRRGEERVRKAAEEDVCTLVLLYRSANELARAAHFKHPLSPNCTYLQAALRWSAEAIAGGAAEDLVRSMTAVAGYMAFKDAANRYYSVEFALRCEQSGRIFAIATLDPNHFASSPPSFVVYDYDEKIDGALSVANAHRFPKDCSSFALHMYAFQFVGKQVFLERRIGRLGGEQDSPLESELPTRSERLSFTTQYCAIDFNEAASRGVQRPEKLFVTSSHGRKLDWEVPREFYAKMACASSFYQRLECARILEHRVMTPSEDSAWASVRARWEEGGDWVLPFFRAFGDILSDIKYESDVEFMHPDRPTDLGDAAVEFTGTGDCEDMAHFSIRMLTQFVDTAQLQLRRRNDPHAKFLRAAADTIGQTYRPMVQICKIENREGNEEYHSTVLLIALKDGFDAIGFEPTNPIEDTEV